MIASWYHVELEHGDALKFRAFLQEFNIKYEASGAWNLVHFSCLMDEVDKFFADSFLRDLRKQDEENEC